MIINTLGSCVHYPAETREKEQIMQKSDQRTRLTKMMIRKSFTALLSQKPIRNISVKELCEKAGINRGTFYAHYLDIYDLMDQMEQEMMADFQTALQPLLESHDQSLTPLAITTGVFRCIQENADLCTVTLGPYGDKEFAARLLSVGRDRCIESYRKYFERASRKQIEYYYAFVSAGCVGLLEKWLGDGMTASAEEMARTAEGIMLGGIRFLAENPN